MDIDHDGSLLSNTILCYLLVASTGVLDRLLKCLRQTSLPRYSMKWLNKVRKKIVCVFVLIQYVCVLFSGPPPTLAAARLSHSGPSWADRVKCTQSAPSSTQSTALPVEKLGKESSPLENTTTYLPLFLFNTSFYVSFR